MFKARAQVAGTTMVVTSWRRWAPRLATVVAVATTLALVPSPAAADAAPPPVQPGGFSAVSPARILDTRTGLGAPAAKVGNASVLELQVTGRGGVPAGGVSAVALNVTVTEPTTAGHLTVFPTGEARPVASSVNFAPGQTVANAVVVKVGTGGKVSIHNSAGSSHLVADVAGWHASTGGVGDNFTSVAPMRIFDSRATLAVGPGAAVTVAVPAPRTTAVGLNVTATEPTAGSHLTVYPSGTPRPLASNLNLAPGQTRANFVAVKVANGAVDIYNHSGSTHVVVDLMGYWSSDSYGRMTPVTPSRILDTRTGFGYAGGAGRRGPDSTFAMHVPERTGVPAGRTAAVVLNVTATQPTSDGYLTVYPSTNKPRPLASSLNFVAGETVPNLVIVPLGFLEDVMVYNRSGHTHVVVDVVGWFDLPGDRLDVDGLSTFGSEIAIDPTSTYAFISSPGTNQVEVLRLADGAFEEPILVGSLPTGLDLSSDGRLLYVANTGSVFVSVVDVAARRELRRFPVPSVNADTPFSIAVLANGKALVTTTFDGSGMGGRIYVVDLATGTATHRTDFSYLGLHSEATVLRASGDRRSAVIAEGNSSSGLVARYDTATDTFTEVETDTYVDSIATNHDGTVTLANGGGMFFDEDMNELGSITYCGGNGAAVNAAGTMGYGFRYDYEHKVGVVAVCDPATFETTGIYSVGSAHDVGRLALSPDGSTLVGITDSGVLLFRL